MAEVRDVIAQVRNRCEPRNQLDLFVETPLTIDGQEVREDVGVAILTDAILAEGLYPQGSTGTGNGFIYHLSTRPSGTLLRDVIASLDPD